MIDDKLIRECPKCDIQTFRDYCIICGSDELGVKTGDPELDELIAAGDENADFDKLFGGK